MHLTGKYRQQKECYNKLYPVHVISGEAGFKVLSKKCYTCNPD
jgi:hypothetical protein